MPILNSLTSNFNTTKLASSGINPTLIYTLDNPNPNTASIDDSFGYTISISNSYIIVGAYAEDDAGGTDSGKAYIYSLSDGSLLHTLDNPNAYGSSLQDYFGSMVKITDTHAIVGAYGEDDGNGYAGKAYIFRPSSGQLLFTIANPNAASTTLNDYFGRAVAISSTYAIAGAHTEDAVGVNGGSAYMFSLSTGALVRTMNNPNAYGSADADGFGFVLGISNNYIIVGAPTEDDSGGVNSGKAYIYSVTSGALLYTLNNPNPTGTSNNDYFGYSVDITDTHAIVGAYREDIGHDEGGAAYVYRLSDGALLYTLANPNPSTNTSGSYGDRFGQSVALSSKYAVVSAPNDDDSLYTDSGKVYIYSLADGTLQHTIDNPNDYGSGSLDFFGWSVAITETHLAVSTYAEFNSIGRSGRAYIFKL